MTTPTALTAIHRAALNLVTEAQRCGVVVTIETTPHQPLAMGNHDMSVSVREARRPSPFAADYSARLGTELLGIVATARAQAKRIIEGTDSPSDLAQDRRDLSETLQVIHHAVQHGLASLTDPGSTDYAQELQALRKKVATYEARDALGLMPQPAGALGPDGKEWAKTAAGYAHVEAMLPRADGQGRGPFWYGWALRGAFVAGAEWQEGRKQLEMAAGAVHVATASPPPSNTLWRLLTNGYDFEFVNQLGDAHPEKSVLIDRATKNWQQICAEVASLRTTTAMSDAARDLLAERARQVQEEGWTPEHDDEHSNGEMAEAAACYAGTAHAPLSLKRRQCSGHWPWAAKWWKPSDARRDLIKAGALILAEIERMDRNGKTEPQDKAA